MHRVHAFNGFSELFSGIEEDHLRRRQLFYSRLKLIGLVTEGQKYKTEHKRAFRCFLFYLFLKLIQQSNKYFMVLRDNRPYSQGTHQGVGAPWGR